MYLRPHINSWEYEFLFPWLLGNVPLENINYYKGPLKRKDAMGTNGNQWENNKKNLKLCFNVEPERVVGGLLIVKWLLNRHSQLDLLERAFSYLPILNLNR